MAGAIGVALFGLALWLPDHRVILGWFVPAADLVMIAVLAMVAVLGSMDAILRRHARSLPLAAAAAASAMVWLPHLLTFPGVVPGALPGAGGQMAAQLAELAHIATPAALALALILTTGPLKRPGRSVAVIMTAACGSALLSVAAVWAVAPALPAAVKAGTFTTFSRVLVYLALVPIGFALAAFASGRRGDERVSGSVASALVLLAFETLTEAIVPGRYVTSFYIANVLRLAPVVVLLIGQLDLYARTVTAEVREEQALRESEARARSVIAASSDAFVEIDPDGRVVSWNARAEELFGWAADEVTGRELAEVVVPAAHRAAHRKGLARVAQTGRVTIAGGPPIEMTALRRDGAEFPVELSVWAVGESSARTYGAFIRDITARKEAQAGLAQLAAVITSSEDAILILDPDGVVLTWNPGAERLYGYNAAEMIGRSGALLAAPGGEAGRAAANEELRAGRASSGEVACIRKDGTIITVWVKRSPVLDDLGRVAAVSSISRDVTERRRFEDQLAASEERYRLLADTATDMVTRVSPESGLFVYVSPSARQVLGWTPIELVGTRFIDIMHPEDAATPQVSQVLAGGDQLHVRTLRIRRRDGTFAWCDSVSRAVVDPSDGNVEIQSSVRDVTDRVAAREALEASEEQFRLAQQSAPIGLALVALDGTWLQVNPALCRILGRQENELGALTFQDLTHPDDLDADLALVNQLLAGDIPDYQMDKRYLLPNGAVVWAQLNVSLVRHRDGSPRHFISQIQDITERRVSEDRLRLQQEIVQTMGEGVVLSRIRDGMIMLTNPQADAMYGYEPGELIDTPISGINAPGDRTPEQVSAEITARCLREGHWAGDVESVRKDGTTFWRRTVISLVEVRGSGTVAVSVHSDITEERAAAASMQLHADSLARLNAELARSNADLDQFASVAAHDLKSPLTTIGGFASMLDSGLGGELNDDGRLFTSYVMKGVDRLQQLVDDLLDFARVGTTASRAALDTADVLGEVQAMLAAEIGASGAKLNVGPLPVVAGDRAQIRQLFMNLVSNAIKFRRPDRRPSVAITADRAPDGWLFTIADDGIGIDDKFHERVFKMFQRLHTAAEYSGTGIGLTICKRVVDNHSGRLWIEANAGGGTRFNFTLPDVSDGRP